MSTVTIVVGRKHIPLNQVALVEPFDPAAYPGMKSDKAFQARIVLIDRQSVLTEDTVEAFAAQGFRLIAEDQVLTNPAVRFSVESFVKTEGFEPSKPFLSRLLWVDLDGQKQSKLLLAPPEAVLAVAVTGEAGIEDKGAEPPREGGGRKPTASSMRPGNRRRRRPQATEEPVPF
jgi:hypothetical protein